MVFELVKNSLRAVQERFMNLDKDAPSVRIIVADGIEDVTIKVCNFFLKKVGVEMIKGFVIVEFNVVLNRGDISNGVCIYF